MNYAISYVENLPRLKDQPIFLIGHSWGAYCVCSVLEYHPEVKAVVSMSGFNTSTDLIRAQAAEKVGIFADVLVPFAKLIERIKLGSYADFSLMTGFASSDVAVMVIQGLEDDQVPLSYGYDKYKKMYGEDIRFTFLLRENRGHDNVYWSDEAISYRENFNIQFKEAYINEPKMTDTEFAQWKLDYLQKNLDRNIWDNVVDKELFESITEFYRNHVQ